MLRTASDFGISKPIWDAAKEQARSAMIERARVQGQITYSDLAVKIRAVKFGPHDPRLFHLLGEISVEENEAGHGMLCAVVVHKHGDMGPGAGFFLLAEHLGYDAKDHTKFWIEEAKKVYAFWTDARRKNSN
jgi:hypothetical protein